MEPKLEKVFGVGDGVVLSYLERPEVNEEFINAIKSPKHIIVYGSSKQGKSSLRKCHLNPDDYVMVAPGHDSSVADMLHQ